ncbi:phosphocholine cytidylyltransferase family protein [Myxococcota bacterium]|nr:phosphocholine cytidylyltransferase family protein [Myxococcota bacterium]MBU1536613.1 phosphocholine cytidylyltransferase family protein [Myxococcota bacterium]
MNVLILAAGIGSRLRPYTDTMPKSLVPLNNTPMLARIVESFKELPVEQFYVVTGYREDQIREFFARRKEPVTFIFNEKYDTAGNGYSLLCAQKELAGKAFFKVDSDLVFEPQIARRLFEAAGDIRVTVDVRDDMGEEEMKVKVDGSGRIVAFSKEIPPAQAWGESIGIEYMTERGGEEVFSELHTMMVEGLTGAYYEEAYGRLAVKGSHVTATRVLPSDRWYEIDNEEDLQTASRIFSGE